MIENIAHQEKRWVLYLHTVSKELSGYDHDKYYVGISSNLKRRWEYKGCSYKGQPFYNAIQKYGWDNIKHEIILENLSEEDAKKFEIETIAKLKSNTTKYGYNISAGGDSGNIKPKCVARYDKNGKLIATYESVLCAEIEINNHSIRNAVRNENALADNSLWRYYTDEPLKEISPYINTTLKPVLQYSLNGDFIREWSSLSKAEKEYKTKAIRECCHGKSKTARGYQWRFKNNNSYPVYDLTTAKRIIKTIYVYSIDGKYIGKFKNGCEAGRFLNIPKNVSLTDCLKNDIHHNQAYGYRWSLSYYEELPPLIDNRSLYRKPFVQIDPTQNKIINIFLTKKEAVNNGFNESSIIKALNKNKIYRGYKWEYIENIKESDITDSFLLEKYRKLIS